MKKLEICLYNIEEGKTHLTKWFNLDDSWKINDYYQELFVQYEKQYPDKYIVLKNIVTI